MKQFDMKKNWLLTISWINRKIIEQKTVLANAVHAEAALQIHGNLSSSNNKIFKNWKMQQIKEL